MEFFEIVAANWPMVVCFAAGVGLLVLEAFMPGFGLPGVSGVICEAVAIALCWFNIGPMAALGMTLVILSLVAIAISMSLRSVVKGKLSKSNMILKDRESSDEGYRSSGDMRTFLGLQGTAATVLRPTGMAQFDGVKLNVISDGEFIPAGTAVRVVDVQGSRIVVHAVP